MASDVRKVYVGSPAFTREDDEHYYYVDTEIDGLMTQDDELLINDAALVSVNHNQYQPVADQPRQLIQDSMLRDSLEDDFSDSNKDSIVVANPSRYEDLTLRGASHQVSRRGIVAKSVERRQHCLHDDIEEYEEAKLERQHQQREARRAHVPHLELCHSDDEPSDRETAFDLEINDGRGSRGHESQKYTKHGKSRRVNFKVVPQNNLKSSDSSQLTDSLEVAECYPMNGRNGDRSLYTDDLAHGKSQLCDAYDCTNSHHSVNTNSQAVPNETYQASASMQYLSAKRQQLSNCPPPPFGQPQVPQYESQSSHTTPNSRRSDESSKANDFIEANRHNVNKKPQRSYGQIYSRKKGKENTADSERSVQLQPADSLSPGHKNRDPAQSSLQPSSESEKSNVPNAEQLWHARSQSLAARKDSAQSVPRKNRQRGKVAVPQNKVSHEVGLNEARPQMPQPMSLAAPYQQQYSNRQQSSARSLNAPVQPEVPGNSPQKVSVDINLNVVSPRPMLDQPSSSLPIRYSSSSPQDVHQYSSRIQATGHYYHPATCTISQPFTAVTQSSADDAAEYTSGTVLPHSQFVSSQPMMHYIESHDHASVPVRYNYSYPQPSTVSVTDTSPHQVHPYQFQQAATQGVDMARENSLPTLSTQSMSPYTVLPPVPSARKEIQKPHSAPQFGSESSLKGTQLIGSYAEQYRRQKKKTDYKMYTIDDYRKLKKETKMNLGTLGPDLDSDSHRLRKEKLHRQQEYALLIQERNRVDLQRTKQPKQKEQNVEQQFDRRRLAIEYAKKVPKPRVLARHNSVDSDQPSSSSSAAAAAAAAAWSGKDTGLMMYTELERLQQRHQLERQQVALLMSNNV